MRQTEKAISEFGAEENLSALPLLWSLDLSMYSFEFFIFTSKALVLTFFSPRFFPILCDRFSGFKSHLLSQYASRLHSDRSIFYILFEVLFLKFSQQGDDLFLLLANIQCDFHLKKNLSSASRKFKWKCQKTLRFLLFNIKRV